MSTRAALTNIAASEEEPRLTVNANNGLVEELLDGVNEIDCAGAGDITPDAAEWNYATLVLTGVRTATGNLVAPATTMKLAIRNATAYAMTVKTSGGTGVAIGAGTSVEVYSDGVDFHNVGADASSLALDSAVVHKTGTESVAGVKTFTSSPLLPTPTIGDNSTKGATTAFVIAQLSLAVAGLLEFIGDLDASANPNYPAANKGDTYYVSVAGKVGGASGASVDVGDAVIAKADNAGGTQASVGTSWFILEKNFAGLILTQNNQWDGVQLFSKAQRWSSDSPAQITADQNDYVLGNAGIQRLNTDALRTITGLAATTSGDIRIITNVGSFGLKLAHSSASSSAGNRILCPDSLDYTISAGQSVLLRYDGTLSKWRVLFTTQSMAVRTRTINFVIDGGGSAIATGIKGDFVLDFAGTIQSATLLADQSGSIVIDLWKDSYANYPPVAGDSITASAKPTISAATKSQDGTLTGWTTAVAAGDIIRVNVDSCSTITRCTLSLKVQI